MVEKVETVVFGYFPPRSPVGIVEHVDIITGLTVSTETVNRQKFFNRRIKGNPVELQSSFSEAAASEIVSGEGWTSF